VPIASVKLGFIQALSVTSYNNNNKIYMTSARLLSAVTRNRRCVSSVEVCKCRVLASAIYMFSFAVKYGKHSNESWPANAANTKHSRFHHFQNVMCTTIFQLLHIINIKQSFINL